jgi:hypothetical protein
MWAPENVCEGEVETIACSNANPVVSADKQNIER